MATRPHPAGTLPIGEWTDDELAQRERFHRRQIATCRHAGDVEMARQGLAGVQAEQQRRRDRAAQETTP